MATCILYISNIPAGRVEVSRTTATGVFIIRPIEGEDVNLEKAVGKSVGVEDTTTSNFIPGTLRVVRGGKSLGDQFQLHAGL